MMSHSALFSYMKSVLRRYLNSHIIVEIIQEAWCVLYKLVSVSPVFGGGDGTGGRQQLRPVPPCGGDKKGVGWVDGGEAIAPNLEAATLAKLGQKMLRVWWKCLEVSPVGDIVV